MSEKQCRRCGVIKQADQFPPRKGSRDGLYSHCRQCVSAKTREWRLRNPERVKAYIAENHDAIKAYQQRYNQENSERLSQRRKEYYRQNVERIAANGKVYRLARSEIVKANVREWKIKNRARSNAKQYRRVARQKANGGRFTPTEWRELCATFGHACACCGVVTKLTVDHVVPICKGGHSNISNIQPLCSACNLAKGKRIIDYRPHEVRQ